MDILQELNKISELPIAEAIVALKTLVPQIERRHKEGAGLVYMNVIKVIGEISIIGKDREGKQLGYNFRSVDDVYKTLNPLLFKYKLAIVPEAMSNHEVKIMKTKDDKESIYESADVTFAIFAEDGSKISVTTRGSGLDRSDKSTGKLMSTAYKYMAFQTFCIPTEERIDVENDDIEILKAKEEEEKQLIESLTQKIRACKTTEELDAFAAEMKTMNLDKDVKGKVSGIFKEVSTKLKEK